MRSASGRSHHVRGTESVPSRDGGRSRVLAASGDARHALRQHQHGHSVPLSAICALRSLDGASGREPSVGVSCRDAVVQPRAALRSATPSKQSNARHATSALPASVHGGFQGTARAFQTSLASEPWLILAALRTMYIVLGILYESLVHPLTILSTLAVGGRGRDACACLSRGRTSPSLR